MGAEQFVAAHELLGVLPSALVRFYSIWRVVERAEEAEVGPGEAAFRAI